MSVFLPSGLKNCQRRRVKLVECVHFARDEERRVDLTRLRIAETTDRSGGSCVDKYALPAECLARYEKVRQLLHSSRERVQFVAWRQRLSRWR